MNLPYEWLVGWRYTRSGRAGRRNGFISFISGVSMLGIALGVATLIIVLSVMNGFQKEVRDRMLSVVSHVEVLDRTGAGLADWGGVAQLASQAPGVVGAAPFVSTQALLGVGEEMRGAMVRGISVSEEGKVTDIPSQMSAGAAQRLQPGAWGIVLGSELARSLHVKEGDKVTVLAPGGQVTPAGVLPRLKQFTVVGTFHAGHFEYDSGLAIIHIEDAQRLFRLQGPSGVQLRLKNLHESANVAQQLRSQMGYDLYVSDWTRANPQWFAAVQVEKRMMFIILTLIVAVAAFNLVSTLVMTVTDKRADIAILRTLGASPRSIMTIFMVQGSTAGVLGTFSGLCLGLLVAFNVDPIVRFIEQLLGVAFLPGSLYLISRMPSDPQRADILPIVVISLLLALAATVYPSWRASRVQPAEALRYE
jgi:lipoprotein-releasing system permease protein